MGEDAWSDIRQLNNDLILALDLIENAQHPLLYEEEVLANGAFSSRVREIRAGRSLSRKAMQMLGVSPAPILSDIRGAPIWPKSICGSIAHTATHVAVVMGRQVAYRSLGIDIEDGRELGAATLDVAQLSELQDLVTARVATDQSRACRMAFSAKEAIFKCQAPVTGMSNLDFRDVLLRPGSGGRLSVEPIGTIPSSVTEFLKTIFVFYKQIQGVTVVVAVSEQT